MREVRVTPDALRDLAAIRRYTRSQWGPGQARTYLEGLGGHFRAIAGGSIRARPTDEMRPGYLHTRYKSHFVFFTGDASIVRIVRVLHVRSDVASHLAETDWS